MIRRAIQIAVSLFIEETGDARDHQQRNTASCSCSSTGPASTRSRWRKLLGLDRSTTGHGARQARAGRAVGRTHRRARQAPAQPDADHGRRDNARPPRGTRHERAQAHVLSAFSTQERAEFLALLDKFTAQVQRLHARAARTASRAGAAGWRNAAETAAPCDGREALNSWPHSIRASPAPDFADAHPG